MLFPFTYRLVLWQQLSLSLGIFGMALLGVPFVLGSTRSMAAGARISLGEVAGLLFCLLERTTGQLTLLYHLPLPAGRRPGSCDGSSSYGGAQSRALSY